VVAVAAPSTAARPVDPPPVSVDAGSPASPPAAPAPRVTFEGNKAASTAELQALLVIDKPDRLENPGAVEHAHASAAIGRALRRVMDEMTPGDPTEAFDRTNVLPLGSTDRDILDHDLLVIYALYYDRGYLAAKLGPPRVEPSRDGRFLDIFVPVEEGPRFRLRKLAISERDATGKTVEPLGGKVPLRNRITLKDGDWFARGVLMRDLDAIRTTYGDAGYPGAFIEPETDLDLAHETVDVAVRMRRNALVTIDRIVVKGNQKVPTDVLLKEIGIPVGTRFSNTGIEQARSRLRALGLRSVDVDSESVPSETRWTVTFEVHED
jgi:outer membrane protein assembly factor BamA